MNLTGVVNLKELFLGVEEEAGKDKMKFEVFVIRLKTGLNHKNKASRSGWSGRAPAMGDP
jgi:hypothetical protein